MNINDSVWVELNDAGWEIFDSYHRDLGLDPAPYREIVDRAPGAWQEFQLWNLMEIFGPRISHSMWPTPFAHNEVRFDQPMPVDA